MGGGCHGSYSTPASDPGYGQFRESSARQQEGAAYNGHFECVCYHPLFLFNQFGIVKQRSYGQATSTVPMIGKKSSIRWWSVT